MPDGSALYNIEMIQKGVNNIQLKLRLLNLH